LLYGGCRYLAAAGVGERVGQEADGAASERRALASGVEQSQLGPLVVAESAAVARLVVVRRQLAQQLPDPVLLARTAGVRNLRLGQLAHVLVHLQPQT